MPLSTRSAASTSAQAGDADAGLYDRRSAARSRRELCGWTSALRSARARGSAKTIAASALRSMPPSAPTTFVAEAGAGDLLRGAAAGSEQLRER